MSLETCMSSGLKTADTAIYARPCKIHGIQLIPAAAASSVVVYDNASAASGTVTAKILAVANGESVNYVPLAPIECLNGIYADVGGTDAAFIIHFSAM